MATVAKLASLQRLYLEGTMVGDDGLKLLTECKDLRYLSVPRTKVTVAGIEVWS